MPVRGGVQARVFGVFAPIDVVTLQLQSVSSFEKSSVAVRGGVQLGVLAPIEFVTLQMQGVISWIKLTPAGFTARAPAATLAKK